MWPKALGQLVELAPHITRLLPLADRYFKDKQSSDDGLRQVLEQQRTFLEAQRAASTDLSDRLHADLGAVTAAQATQGITLQRHMTELEQRLSTASADALAAKRASESLSQQLTRIETAQKNTRAVVLATLALLVIVALLLAILLLRGR